MKTQFPQPCEFWWVAVPDAPDPSGGWWVLADPGASGAQQIQGAFGRAGVGLLSAVDAASLDDALAQLAPQGGDVSLAWWEEAGRVHHEIIEGSSGEALLTLRMDHPQARILLCEEIDGVIRLRDRMFAILEQGEFGPFRLDLRSPPRGAGALGLIMAKVD